MKPYFSCCKYMFVSVMHISMIKKIITGNCLDSQILPDRLRWNPSLEPTETRHKNCFEVFMINTPWLPQLSNLNVNNHAETMER